jgi:hypothetical protein
MRALRLLVLCSFFAGPALAWDGNRNWEELTTGPTSGGGGNWGTGGRTDRGITCANCHVGGPAFTQGRIGLDFVFTPALESVGGQQGYQPGRRYQVQVRLTGEWRGLSGCGQYLMHMNGFGAAFELGNGQRAGRYETDAGQDSNSCPATIPDNNSTMAYTTITYGRCHAVTSTGTEGRTTWSLYWTAPAAGSGAVKVSWGAVDGNCDMNSMGDDVKVGSFNLAEGIAQAPPRAPRRLTRPGFDWSPALASRPRGLEPWFSLL